MADELKPVEPYHFEDMKVGWIGIEEGDSYYRADIDVGDHGGKIVCYAATPTEAEAMAKQIIAWNTRADPQGPGEPGMEDRPVSHRNVAWMRRLTEALNATYRFD